MLMSLCGGMVRFQTERHALKLNPGALVKNTLKLHKSLNNDMACNLALAILRKKPDKANPYAYSIINLTKLNGVKDNDQKRVIIRWSMWLTNIDYVENMISKVRARLPLNKPKPKRKPKQKTKKQTKPKERKSPITKPKPRTPKIPKIKKNPTDKKNSTKPAKTMT